MRSTISMSVNYQQSHLSLLIREAGAETLFGKRGRESERCFRKEM